MSHANLADRCFDACMAEGELYEATSAIVAFPEGVSDTAVDYYDASVEVVLCEGVPRLTREQVDAILALGFSVCYESPAGVRWTASHSEKCSPRAADESLNLAALRAKLKDAEATRDAALEEARGMLA